MEYVEKLTLRETIEDGLSEVDSWRLLFQILSAMLHFTSLNILHRDLKPSNIFIDVKGDVRIGDFGLAVNEGGAEPTDAFLSIENSMDESDLTSGVGTSLYIAPEMMSRARQERSVKYSNKIDMYSLGIVFFEMWHPFKTGMERIQVLHDLRRPEIVFPPTWDKVKLARHTKIVQACLTHNPELRPSPKDLLSSDLLPPRVGDDSIEETIRLLSQSGTTHAQTLISALFNQSDEDRMRKDFSYDFYDGQGAKVDNDPYAQLVHDKLSRIFRQKGAVQMDSPLLMPHSQIYASRKPVRLLDSDGTIVCLPFQLNIPFCRMVARDTSLTRLKRWTIAPVFRPAAAGGQPRAILNAAFDIVSDAVMPAMEAECIFVIEEILDAFPLAGKPAHLINHSKILDAIVDIFPSKQRDAICEILVQHGRLQRTWVKTSSELFKLIGVTRAMCDLLGALNTVGTSRSLASAAPPRSSLPLLPAGDLGKMRSLVLSAVPRLKHVVQEGFDELRDIISLCEHMGVKNVKVAPLLATNHDLHHDGAIFESHVVHGKTRDVVAAGGRFDDVVSRLAAPEVRFSGRCPHVVGFSLAVAKLSVAAAEANATAGKHAMTRKEEHLRSYGPWAIRRCDVYVCSFSSGLIDLRLDIVKDLWKAGIKADLMYDDDFLTLTPEQLVSACRREGILWLVIVKPSAAGRSAADESDMSLKVKSVLRGAEEEVPRVELPIWLVEKMREQSIVDEAVGGGNNDTVTDASTSLVDPPKPTREYIPLLADDDVRQKGRHNKRTMIAHRAEKNIEEAAKAASEAPVFAVDIDGLAFERMANSPIWVTNDDAFKALLHTAPPGKREYYASIRQAIQKHRRQKAISRFWLFSLRDDRSVLCSFFDGIMSA
ncbi:eukaryotic translation initiation factor 2-alpha kinase [Rhodotorula kratochvilovae]